MTLPALVLSAVTGFQVNWSSEPARGPEGGLVHMTLELSDEDLLFVTEDGMDRASWEVAAGVDGSYSVRESGTVLKEQLPAIQEVTLEGLQPGEHLVNLMVTDRETGNSTFWEENVEISMVDSSSWSSANLQVEGGPYQRADGEVGVMWSVYPPTELIQPGDTLRAAFVMRDHDGVTEREGWMDLAEREGYYRGSVDLDLRGLEAGQYDILAALVANDRILTAARTDINLLQWWDVWGDDPDLTETLVRPIARSSELTALENADGPANRRAVMAEFWQRRDPTPGTQRNEYLELYLHRLDEIDRRFSAMNTMGINTDQGRVYALLGEPDIIQSSPMEDSTLPTQIWTYCSPPIEVLFVDRYGVGIYELETDWEEVQAFHERHS